MNLTEYKNKVIKSKLEEDLKEILLDLDFETYDGNVYISTRIISLLTLIPNRDLVGLVDSFIENEKKRGVKVDSKINDSDFGATEIMPGFVKRYYVNIEDGERYPLYLLNLPACFRVFYRINNASLDYAMDVIETAFRFL